MRLLRLSLIVVAIFLLLIDVRAVSFLLHGPDVLHVVPESDGLRVVSYRFTAGDYAAVALLVAVHGVVGFGLIRTRHAR